MVIFDPTGTPTARLPRELGNASEACTLEPPRADFWLTIVFDFSGQPDCGAREVEEEQSTKEDVVLCCIHLESLSLK